MVAKLRQFDVCVNADANAANVPFIINLQHDFAHPLATRIAAPLLPQQVQRQTIENAVVRVTLQGTPLLLAISEMAAVPVQQFGEVVANLDDQRFTILKAIDFLISGY